MHFTLVVVACLQALALAHPGARFDEHDLILPRASQNGTVGNATVIDDEPIPVLKKPCVCPEVTPDPRLNAQSQCQFKAAAAQACFLKSDGGCPQPPAINC